VSLDHQIHVNRIYQVAAPTDNPARQNNKPRRYQVYVKVKRKPKDDMAKCQVIYYSDQPKDFKVYNGKCLWLPIWQLVKPDKFPKIANRPALWQDSIQELLEPATNLPEPQIKEPVVERRGKQIKAMLEDDPQIAMAEFMALVEAEIKINKFTIRKGQDFVDKRKDRITVDSLTGNRAKIIHNKKPEFMDIDALIELLNEGHYERDKSTLTKIVRKVAKELEPWIGAFAVGMLADYVIRKFA